MALFALVSRKRTEITSSVMVLTVTQPFLFKKIIWWLRFVLDSKLFM